MVREMLPDANAAQRQPIPASELSLALQCGGSDAYSGITANPALGAASDVLVRHGGTGILAETPEIYGAEHLLTRRAVSREVGEKLIERIKWWEDYCARNGGEMNNNPSPGNKAGGLTHDPREVARRRGQGRHDQPHRGLQIRRAGDRARLRLHGQPGLRSGLGHRPGGLGRQLVCFTTGRGSCFGFKPAPSIKLATNTEMYRRMEEDMDVNCGVILDGEVTLEEMGQRIFDLVLEVASGRRTKSEALGLGNHEFTPWQIGAVM